MFNLKEFARWAVGGGEVDDLDAEQLALGDHLRAADGDAHREADQLEAEKLRHGGPVSTRQRGSVDAGRRCGGREGRARA